MLEFSDREFKTTLTDTLRALTDKVDERKKIATPRIVYSVKLCSKVKRWKDFLRKKKMKEFVTGKPALQEILKDLNCREEKRESYKMLS